MLELDDDTTESLETIYDHVVQEHDQLCRLVHRGEEAEETLLAKPLPNPAANPSLPEKLRNPWPWYQIG